MSTNSDFTFLFFKFSGDVKYFSANSAELISY